MDITRRDLLKQLGALTAGAAVVSLKEARAAEKHVPHVVRAILINVTV